MPTDAPIMAIAPTTDIERAKACYGETLVLTDANASIPGPQVIYLNHRRFPETWFRDPDGNILRIHSQTEI